MIQQALAVFLVLGLLLGMLFVLKRSDRSNFSFSTGRVRFNHRGYATAKRMQVVERVALTPQHSLHLVVIDGRLLVFAASPAGCHAVSESSPTQRSGESESLFSNGAAT